MAKVLIVESGGGNSPIVEHQLDQAGYEHATAEGLDEGWRSLLAEYPSVAVVDISQKQEAAWTFVEKIRADGRFSKLPVLILAAAGDEGVQTRARDLGCGYLDKPFAAAALLSRIEAELNGRPAGTAPATNGTKMAPPPPGGAAEPDHKVDLVATRVVVLLSGYRVEGDVYLSPELERFSDAWESVVRDGRAFLPLTDATIVGAAGEEPVAHADFIQVRKDDVQGVFPLPKR